MDVTVNGVLYREALHTTDRRGALALKKKRVSEIQQGKAASKSSKDFAGSRSMRQRRHTSKAGRAVWQSGPLNLTPRRMLKRAKRWNALAEDVETFPEHQREIGKALPVE
jgi:hypothetical protein